jgi:hypothetical protein
MRKKKIIGGTVLFVGLSTAGLVGVASADSGSEPKITCSTEAPKDLPGAQTTKATKTTGARKSTAVMNEDGTVTKKTSAEPPAGAAAMNKVTHKVEIKDGKVLFDGKPAPAGSGCDSADVKTVKVTNGAPPATR